MLDVVGDQNDGDVVGNQGKQPTRLRVVDGDRVRRDSDAVLAIWDGLGWPWRAATAFRLVPRALRDYVYRWVARNRYRLFGRRDTCWLPDPAFRDRML